MIIVSQEKKHKKNTLGSNMLVWAYFAFEMIFLRINKNNS